MNIREYRKLSTSENEHHGKIRKWSPYEFSLDHHEGHRICEEMVGKAETMVDKFGENGR